MMNGYVYLLRNKLNGKCYVGQTCDFERRMAEHEYEAKSGSSFKIHQAIRKYGMENFDTEILHSCQGEEQVVLEELNSLEIYYIRKFNSFFDGYNMTEGSRGALGLHHTEEARQKISKARSGLTLSEEHKAAISRSNHVRTVTSETRAKMSENNAMKDPANRAKVSKGVSNYIKSLTPEQLSERGRKIWESRRRNAALKQSNH